MARGAEFGGSRPDPGGDDINQGADQNVRAETPANPPGRREGGMTVNNEWHPRDASWWREQLKWTGRVMRADPNPLTAFWMLRSDTSFQRFINNYETRITQGEPEGLYAEKRGKIWMAANTAFGMAGVLLTAENPLLSGTLLFVSVARPLNYAIGIGLRHLSGDHAQANPDLAQQATDQTAHEQGSRIFRGLRDLRDRIHLPGRRNAQHEAESHEEENRPETSFFWTDTEGYHFAPALPRDVAKGRHIVVHSPANLFRCISEYTVNHALADNYEGRTGLRDVEGQLQRVAGWSIVDALRATLAGRGIGRLSPEGLADALPIRLTEAHPEQAREGITTAVRNMIQRIQDATPDTDNDAIIQEAADRIALWSDKQQLAQNSLTLRGVLGTPISQEPDARQGRQRADEQAPEPSATPPGLRGFADQTA